MFHIIKISIFDIFLSLLHADACCFLGVFFLLSIGLFFKHPCVSFLFLFSLLLDLLTVSVC